MSKEYTVSEFANLFGKIATNKVPTLMQQTVREVGNAFIDEAVEQTSRYTANRRTAEAPDDESVSVTSGIKEGWEANRNAPISSGGKVYTMSITNRATNDYYSQWGKDSRWYYAYFVDEGHKQAAGYKPMINRTLKKGFVKGKKFTKASVKSTNAKKVDVVLDVIDKWFDEVF